MKFREIDPSNAPKIIALLESASRIINAKNDPIE